MNRIEKLLITVSLISLLFAQTDEVVAIFDFKTTEDCEQNLGWRIAELIINNFNELNYYTVVERDQIDMLLNEQQHQLSPVFDEKTNIELGKMLKADKILVGSIFQLDSKIVITARILDVQTGKVIIGKSAEGKYYSELPKLCKKLVYLLSEIKFDDNKFKLDIIQVNGYGYPPKDIEDKGRARMISKRAAILDAKRNLLEKVKGIRIDSRTIINDYLTQNDVIHTKVSGFISGIDIINTRYLKDGSVIVTLEINEEELKNLIKKNIE